MGFRDIKINTRYITKLTNISREFLVPVLSEAVEYKRAVGFFSSSAFIEIGQGLGRLAMRGGRIKLVASPVLSEEDVNAIDAGYERREQILKNAIVRELPDPDALTNLEKDRLNLLAELIATGALDVRIAFAESKTGYGIYHAKTAILIDENGDKIAFSGSMNESATAMKDNYEEIDVYRSWNDPEDRVRGKEASFDAVWNDYEPGVRTFEFDDVKEEIVKRYLRKKPDYGDDLLDPIEDIQIVEPQAARKALAEPYPEIPPTYELRGYQKEAIDAWENKGFKGIFDMATGTGKTVTGLAAIERLSKSLSNRLAVVIVCPYQHLVDQWVEDIRLFNMDPIIGYSTSPQKDWLSRLDDAIRNQKYGVQGCDFFCFVCTNGSYATAKVQKALNKIKGNKLIVVDEAHNFGAECLRSMLREDFQYRLALSATIERFGDAEGTDAIFTYFGERCIEYTLEEAIRGRDEEPPCLTPYRYYPIVINLEEDELEQYSRLSQEIAKAVRVDKSGRKKLTEQGKRLALKRARIVAAAHQKLEALRVAIAPYSDDNYMLVYCGATKVEIDGGEIPGVDEYEMRQIDAVTRILGDELDMKVRQFTSRESSSEREEIKKMFSNAELQALIAIKCLDEGVNIPLIKTAFILASTTNPREYVQRRGRLLRKDRNGLKKRAEIFDFITVPRDPEMAAVLPDEDTRGEKRLVYNELIRAKEFASLAENRAQATQILDEIEEGFFGINGIDGFQDKEVE